MSDDWDIKQEVYGIKIEWENHKYKFVKQPHQSGFVETCHLETLRKKLIEEFIEKAKEHFEYQTRMNGNEIEQIINRLFGVEK